MEAPAACKRGYLNVRYVFGQLYVQLNHHSKGSAVLLPLRSQRSVYPGDLSLRRASTGVDSTWVNLRDLRIFNQSWLTDPARQERFHDEELKIFHGITTRAFATTNRCALLQSYDVGTQRNRYTVRLGAVEGGFLAVPVAELQFLQIGDFDLGAIVFHPQMNARVVEEYPGTRDVSRRLDDWKYHHILDPLMKAAVPFEEIEYRRPEDIERRRLW